MIEKKKNGKRMWDENHFSVEKLWKIDERLILNVLSKRSILIENRLAKKNGQFKFLLKVRLFNILQYYCYN